MAMFSKLIFVETGGFPGGLSGGFSSGVSGGSTLQDTMAREGIAARQKVVSGLCFVGFCVYKDACLVRQSSIFHELYEQHVITLFYPNHGCKQPITTHY
jgi:hypothetical protein